MKPLGILLVLVGLLAFSYGGFSYMKNRRVLDVGPLHVSTSWRESSPIPPAVGAAALVAGCVLLVSTRRRAA
jgi:hypothetical protein